METQNHTTEPVVTCPECGHRFPLSQALVGPIEAQVAQRLEAKYEQRERQRAEETQRHVAQAAALAAQKAKADQATETAALRQEVAEQRDAIAKLQAQELEQRKRARDVEAREKALALDVERQVDARGKTVEEETAKRVQHRLKDAEKDKVIAELTRQLEAAVLKVQQGSQQVQGEVAELDLETQLHEAFPRDKIEPVAKGQRGADVLQHVLDPRGQACGTITWERKNAKNFSDTWVPKLREDQRANHAEVAVLVSATLPKDVVVLGQHGGVWVTTPTAALPLAIALRIQLLEVARARTVAEGQAGKQTALLAYASGTEFKQRVEAMLDPLIAMMDDFDKERRTSETNWARRQKRHDQLMRGIAGLWGDVSGIIGTLATPKQLQLPAGEEGGKAA